MVYSSSLSDREWEILEPLLPEILPQKKRTRPLNWTKREILDGILYQLKNGCNSQSLFCPTDAEKIGGALVCCWGARPPTQTQDLICAVNHPD
jgi:hypothetical protein